MADTYWENETKKLWEEIACARPKFKPIHAITNDPMMVGGIVLDGLGFDPFEGAKVMDIGANIGVFSAFCAVYGSQVTAYEPSAEAYHTMTIMIQNANLQAHIKAVNKGIWINTGKMPFRCFKTQGPTWIGYNGYRPIEGISTPQPEASESKIESEGEVDCLSLQEAVSNEMWDCVKFDVEGAEFQTIMATPDEVFSQIKFLTFELHPVCATFEYYQKFIAKLKQFYALSGVKEGDSAFTGQDRYRALYCKSLKFQGEEK